MTSPPQGRARGRSSRTATVPAPIIAADFDSDESIITVVPLPDSMYPEQEAKSERRRPFSLGLFWRTLLLLLLGSALGWYQLFRTLEYEPRIVANAHQVASLVNLSRAALSSSDAIARIALIKTLASQEQVNILPREPLDTFEPLTQDRLERRISDELVTHLGPDTVVAGSVNRKPGLWIGFSVARDAYWLQMDRSRIGTLLGGSVWLLWLGVLAVLSLLGALALARLITQPLRRLAVAAAHVREGDYQQRLDEDVSANEIRSVNIGFNRMADQLGRVERERTEILAGVSHDLRTPLARLRLETEMSVPDPEVRDLMAADIEQVDTIIEKFLDYARPDRAALQALPLADLARACAQPFAAREDMRVQINIPTDLYVIGDEIELARALTNLLENARCHGRTPGTKITRVRMAAQARDRMVTLRVRDYGPGVPADQLSKLTRPFYRGDSARTSASGTGTGLGLAIVAKVVRHMGGLLEFGNSSNGGLVAVIHLPQAPEQPPPEQ